MNRRRCLALTATAAGFALTGCTEEGDFESGTAGGSGDSDGGSGGTNGDTDGDGGGDGGSSSDIELLSHELVREDDGEMAETVAVEGEAENVSGQELSYAEVEVKFYEGDTLAESFLDNINNFGPGETWAFEVQYPGIGEDAAAITDYQIRAGSSF